MMFSLSSLDDLAGEEGRSMFSETCNCVVLSMFAIAALPAAVFFFVYAIKDWHERY